MTTPTVYVHPALLPVASAVTGRGDGAAGSYTVLDGVLTETWRDGPGPTHRAVRPHHTGSAFGPDRVHVVANQGSRNATSVHAYSPPLLPLAEGLPLDESA